MMEKYRGIGFWDRGYGRWNTSCAHESLTTGLVYLLHEFGAGRTKERWQFLAFAPGTRLTAYCGKQKTEDISRGLIPLFVLEGKGGLDTGKSAMSKGGYRPGGAIPYCLADGSAFDEALLDDGDELLRRFLGIEEVSAESARAGAIAREERIRREIREAINKEAERNRLFEASWKREQAAREEKRVVALAAFEREFSSPPELPAGFTGEVTERGYFVSPKNDSHFPRFGQNFTAQDALVKWIEREIADGARRAREAGEYARAAEDRECQEEAAKQTAKKALPGVLAKLKKI